MIAKIEKFTYILLASANVHIDFGSLHFSFAIVYLSSDCDTETETIYSAQSTDTIAANDKIADDEAESEVEEDFNEYEPESCEEEERPPQVPNDMVEKPRPSRLTKINMKG